MALDQHQQGLPLSFISSAPSPALPSRNCRMSQPGYPWPPLPAPVCWQGINIAVALKPKMPTGCGDVTRGANQAHPPSPMEGECLGWQEGAHPSTELWDPRASAPDTLHGIMGWGLPHDFFLILKRGKRRNRGFLTA